MNIGELHINKSSELWSISLNIDAVVDLHFVLGDESGLCCNICREGYKFQPAKVLAIYTYTRPSTVDPFEAFAGAGGGPTPFHHHPSGTKDL